MTNFVTISQAVQLIYTSKGKIFNAEFIKKDGSYRSMNCRMGVQKDLKGKGLAYDPYKYNLIGVFDMVDDSYKMINLNGLMRLKIAGQNYEVVR